MLAGWSGEFFTARLLLSNDRRIDRLMPEAAEACEGVWAASAPAHPPAWLEWLSALAKSDCADLRVVKWSARSLVIHLTGREPLMAERKTESLRAVVAELDMARALDMAARVAGTTAWRIRRIVVMAYESAAMKAAAWQRSGVSRIQSVIRKVVDDTLDEALS